MYRRGARRTRPASRFVPGASRWFDRPSPRGRPDATHQPSRVRDRHRGVDACRMQRPIYRLNRAVAGSSCCPDLRRGPLARPAAGRPVRDRPGQHVQLRDRRRPADDHAQRRRQAPLDRLDSASSVIRERSGNGAPGRTRTPAATQRSGLVSRGRLRFHSPPSRHDERGSGHPSGATVTYASACSRPPWYCRFWCRALAINDSRVVGLCGSPQRHRRSPR